MLVAVILSLPDEEEEDQLEEDDDEQEEEVRADWMLLAEMGPSAVIDVSSDLGSRDMDRNHDWATDTRQRYPDLVDAHTFVQQASSEGGAAQVAEVVNYQALNERQRTIFERVASHYATGQVDPLRIMVMGTAGTGKSYLINSIRGQLRQTARDRGIHED